MAEKRNINIISDVVVVPRKQQRMEEKLEEIVQYSLGDELQIPEVGHQVVVAYDDDDEDVIIIEEEEEITEDTETASKIENPEEEEQNAQIFEEDDDATQISEQFLAKLELFKNGSAAMEFELPKQTFKTDHNDHMLACSFTALNSARDVFAAVGIDPNADFEVMFRVADIRSKRYIQFRDVGRFTRAVKTARALEKANVEGLNLTLWGSSMKIAGGRYSVMLRNNELDVLILAEQFLYRNALRLERDFGDLRIEYLQILQDMVVSNTFGTTMDIQEYLLRNCVRYNNTKIFTDMHTYYYTRFNYHLAIVTRFIKKENKEII